MIVTRDERAKTSCFQNPGKACCCELVVLFLNINLFDVQDLFRTPILYEMAFIVCFLLEKSFTCKCIP